MHEGTYKDKEKHVKTNRLIASNCHGHIDRQLYEYEMFIYSRLFFSPNFKQSLDIFTVKIMFL